MTTENKLQNSRQEDSKSTSGGLLRYFGGILAVAVLFYGISPFIIESLIRYTIPSDIKLKVLEMNYPNTSGISISKIEAEWNDYSLEISGITIDYASKNLDIKHIKLDFLTSENQDSIDANGFELSHFLENGKLIVPQLELEKIVLTNLIEHLTIRSLNIATSSGYRQFVDFDLTVDPFGQLKAKVIIKDENAQGTTSNYILSANLLDSIHSKDDENTIHKIIGKTATLDLLDGNQKIATVSLSSIEEKATIKSELSERAVTLLNHQLGRQNYLLNVTKLQIDWFNDYATMNSRLLLKGEMSINDNRPTNLKQNGIALTGSNKDQSVNADWQVDLNIIDGDSIDVKGAVKFDDELGISCLKEEGCEHNYASSATMEKPNLEFSTSAKIELDAKQVKEINIMDSQLRLSMNSIRINSKKSALLKPENINDKVEGAEIDGVISIDNFVLSTAVKPVAIDFIDFQDNDRSVKNSHDDLRQQIKLKSSLTAGNFEYSPKVVENRQPKVFRSPLASEFSIYVNEDSIFESEGELELIDVTVKAGDILSNGTFKINWSNVNQLLSSGKVGLALEGSHLSIDTITLDDLSIGAEVNIAPLSIEGEGSIEMANQVITPFDLVFDKKTSNLSLEFSKEQLESRIFNPIVSAIGKKNKLDVELAEGNTKQKTLLSFSDKFSINSRMLFEDMLFVFGENTISGMTIRQQISSIDPLKMEVGLSVEKIEFNSGLLVERIEGKIDTSSVDTSRLKNFQAHLFGGEVTAKELIFSDGELHPSLIEMSNISLTELIFFMDLAGLYGEGDLNISLPISMIDGSLVISKGRFEAQSGGILKYSTAELEPNEEENIALKALRNFHYKTLDGDISYNHEGTYAIRLHLLGSNPDLYDGYPIDFVLNLNGELSGVFRSLFLTGSFEEAVMEQVKTGQIEQQQTDN